MLDSQRSRRLRANGLTHQVHEWGPEQGPCVLLLHGFLDLALSFAELASLLGAQGYRVIAPDLRGHGQTDWVPTGGYYYFPDYVLDLHELVPQLTTQSLHVVGHSMGGGVATLYAALHPNTLQTLALIEGFGPGAEQPHEALPRLQRWLTDVDAVRTRPASKLRNLQHAVGALTTRHAKVPRAFLEALAPHTVRETADGLTWAFDPLHRTRSPVGLDAARFAEVARSIDKPTLLVQGGEGLRWGDEATRFSWFQHGHHELVHDAGHMMHWTHARELSDLLLAHFAGR